MNIVIGRNVYSNFISASVTTAMDTLARSFSFVAATGGGAIPFQAGQTCDILVDDERVLRGFIEKLSFTTDENGTTYTVEGRDLMADVMDSNLPELEDLGFTVAAIARRVLSYLGVNAGVIDLANTAARPFEDAYDIVSPEASDTAFEFLERVALRRQVLLTSDGDGNMVLTRGIGTLVDQKLINRIDGKGNNMVGVDFATDHSQRFGRYETESQGNVAAIGSSGGNASPSEIVDGRAFVLDQQAGMRTSRRRNVSNESSYPEGDGLDRARWERSLARARSHRYTAKVPSHRDGAGQLWAPNTAISVEDEFYGIQARMLVAGVTYTLDEEGRTSVITLTDRNAFKLQLEDTEGYDNG